MAAENAGIQEKLGTDKSGKTRYRITSHAIRHGHARHTVLNTDIKLPMLQRQLGHKKLETTQTYLQFVETDVIDAYEGWA